MAYLSKWPKIFLVWILKYLTEIFLLNVPCIVLDDSSGHDHNHNIVSSDFMKASMFGVYKVRIRHPDAIHYRVAKEHGLVEPVIKPLVCPLLSKEDVQQKVLVTTATAESNLKHNQNLIIPTFSLVEIFSS